MTKNNFKVRLTSFNLVHSKPLSQKHKKSLLFLSRPVKISMLTAIKAKSLSFEPKASDELDSKMYFFDSWFAKNNF
jgi:hypothetical protein